MLNGGAETAIDPGDLRACFGRFATGVTVVTARGAGGDPLGMTVNSFTSVSLEPPLILFCLAKSCYSLPEFQNAAGFGINVLSAGQQAISTKFARPLTEKWTDVDWHHGINGAPLLNGALATMECTSHAQHDVGDHVIFIAGVHRLSLHDQADAPLLFWRGGYHSLDGRT